MKRTLILGAGFGGITVATELRRHLGDDHDIVLVDRREHFTMGLRKLWAVVGIGRFEEGSRSRQGLNKRGVRFLNRSISEIDPGNRKILTDQETLEGDYLVVALGAESRSDLIPGLTENAHNVWDVRAVPGLADTLDRFTGGRIAIVIAGEPYPCPPAPFECSMLFDDYLRERGLRDQTEITVTTMKPMLLPNAGKRGSEWMAAQLSARGIKFHEKREVERLEPGRIVFSDGTLDADLIIGVPPHRVPAVVRASGLTGDGEWISVDPATLETDYENVFAVGDVTKIQLANGLSLPKAGAMAELEGQRVAEAIAADVLGAPAVPPFDGQGYCFVEMGKTKAALLEGKFFATPEPEIKINEASGKNAEDKRRFEADRLAKWFGVSLSDPDFEGFRIPAPTQL